MDEAGELPKLPVEGIKQPERTSGKPPEKSKPKDSVGVEPALAALNKTTPGVPDRADLQNLAKVGLIPDGAIIGAKRRSDGTIDMSESLITIPETGTEEERAEVFNTTRARVENSNIEKRRELSKIPEDAKKTEKLIETSRKNWAIKYQKVSNKVIEVKETKDVSKTNVPVNDSLFPESNVF